MSAFIRMSDKSSRKTRRTLLGDLIRQLEKAQNQIQAGEQVYQLNRRKIADVNARRALRLPPAFTKRSSQSCRVCLQIGRA